MEWQARRGGRDISHIVETYQTATWDSPPGLVGTVEALEQGKVLYFPQLAFDLMEAERRFLARETVNLKSKNISFNPLTGKVKHAQGSDADLAAIAAMMRRYCEQTATFIRALLPAYSSALDIGRTSFRPVEISGRVSSRRQNDTLLHVDAFPTSPMGVRRILRIFTNVNPDGMRRHWRLGSSFEDVAQTFLPNRKMRVPGGAWFMRSVGLTKGTRTKYDHLMLGIHDAMKRNRDYQARAIQNDCHFPPGTTWIAYTDQVSHAAMAGQHLFEQTFYLPVYAMRDSAAAPLRILERLVGHELV